MTPPFVSACRCRHLRRAITARPAATGARWLATRTRFQIIGGAEAPLQRRSPPPVKDPVHAALRRLRSAGVLSLMEEAIAHWRQQKTLDGSRAVVPDRVFEAWRSQVALGLDEFFQSRSRRDLDELDDGRMTACLEMIMIEKLIAVGEDPVSVLCPSVPAIGSRHEIDGRDLDLVARRFALDSGRDGSGRRLLLTLIWRCVRDPQTSVETEAVLAGDDLFWPGSVPDLVECLTRQQQL